MDSKALIRGLRRGESASYEELFRLHFARFVAFAYAITRDRVASEDLVQEAFMKIWINRSKLDENLSLENYLYVLVKRAVLNFIRDRKFVEALDSDGLLELAGDSDTIGRISEKETRERLISGVASLPPQRRTVFLLSREEGLSNKAIAERLGLSEKTVERHITLALSDLRRHFS